MIATGGEPVVVAPAGVRARAADYWVLAKVRMNLLVAFSTFVGAFLASRGPLDFGLIAHAIIGTVLVSVAASALNQYVEREVDAKMHRTRDRPLPTGRMAPREALVVGAVLAPLGIGYLAIFTNLLTAALATLTVVTYVCAYTPLKRRSSLSTLVGAVPGALPAMGGWTAVRGTLDVEAWILFSIVFFWQLPHFMAIAWRHREDYARGGLPVLPVVDDTGRTTGQQVVFHTMALLPITLLPTLVGLTGGAYFVGACLLGLGFLAVVLAFVRGNRDLWARALFRTSIVYLGALFSLMMLDKSGVL